MYTSIDSAGRFIFYCRRSTGAKWIFLFPAKWGLDAYAYLWKTRATLLQAYKMTFIVTTIGVVSSLTVTTLFAYGLSKKHFREEVYLHLWCFFHAV